MRYQIVAEAYRDLEGASARLALIDRLATLVRQTPDELLPPSPCCARSRSRPTSPGSS